MSTIRPLATIAVLAALGVFLALEINKGPAVALSDDADWSTESPLIQEGGGEPPAFAGEQGSLTAIDMAPTARSAPSWAESGTAAPAEPSLEPEPPKTPSFPTLPKLPALDKPTTNPPPVAEPPPVKGQPMGTTLAEEGAPSFPTATQDKLPLPDVIPQASYPDSQGPPPAGVSGRVPSLGSETKGYGQPSATTPNNTLGGPVDSAPGFEAAWRGVQSALQRGELVRAHRMLSPWRREPKLSPEQQQRVEGLLGQLAGSVVYSTDHGLEPPHVVKAGETLATIAQQYEVPWQLLAKINGIPSADGVTPGQTLKVVRGPFDAEIDLKRGELTLLLDERYAGKFPVRVEGSAPADGDWRVGQKRLDNTPAITPIPGAVPTEPRVVLESSTGEKVELSSSPTPTPGSSGRLTVASRDLSDLFDILSVGSSVTVRR